MTSPLTQDDLAFQDMTRRFEQVLAERGGGDAIDRIEAQLESLKSAHPDLDTELIMMGLNIAYGISKRAAAGEVRFSTRD